VIAFGKGPCDEAVVHSAGEALVCDAATRRWVLAATILGSSIAFIDGTVVNVALPVIQERLGASVRGAQWIVEAYALGLASLLLVGGALVAPAIMLTVGAKLWNVYGATTMLDAHAASVTQTI